jgi:hypothetical protein
MHRTTAFSPKVGKHERRIAFYVFRLGGVAGVARSIVRRQRALFTKMQILGTLWANYPGLEPAQQQLEDFLSTMERRRFIECIDDNSHGKLYRRLPPQPKPDRRRWRQLKFDFT